jgi:preprotein translocase subunit SecA
MSAQHKTEPHQEIPIVRREVVETIVRERPKIGRNDRVTIKHVMSGENKTLKYKQAIPYWIRANWVLVED